MVARLSSAPAGNEGVASVRGCSVYWLVLQPLVQGRRRDAGGQHCILFLLDGLRLLAVGVAPMKIFHTAVLDWEVGSVFKLYFHKKIISLNTTCKVQFFAPSWYKFSRIKDIFESKISFAHEQFSITFYVTSKPILVFRNTLLLGETGGNQVKKCCIIFTKKIKKLLCDQMEEVRVCWIILIQLNRHFNVQGWQHKCWI